MLRSIRCPVATALAVLTLGGCYSYRQVDPSRITPETQVRVTAARGDSLQVRRDTTDLSTRNLRVVQGRVQSLHGDSLALGNAVLFSGSRTGYATRRGDVWMVLQQAHLVEKQQFSAGKTALAVAASLVALLGFVAQGLSSR